MVVNNIKQTPDPASSDKLVEMSNWRKHDWKRQRENQWKLQFIRSMNGAHSKDCVQRTEAPMDAKFISVENKKQKQGTSRDMTIK